MRRATVAIVVSLVLAGCTEERRPTKTRAERLQDAEIAVGKTPTPRTYRIDGNEFKVIEFPVKDPTGWLEMQRCFVWRDAEFKTSSISCEKAPELMLEPVKP